jgi:hypothetical protein
MRGPWTVGVVACVVALVGLGLRARGDAPTSAPAGSAASNDEVPPGWRFAPPDPGPASALWQGTDLSDRERAYVAHAAANPNAAAINAAYASATAERATVAAHAAATVELGVDSLGVEGVIP